jgi:drug/metabolite transporter (DMT)-like permease
MYLEIITKIISESLLSLYPLFVKYINIPIGIQLWSRFFTYVIVSLFFINIPFIFKNIFTKSGILLSLVTLAHVYFSYRGFQLLESGVAYIIFYTYPLMILLLAGEKINFLMIFAIIGIILLSQGKIESFTQKIFTKKENVKEKFNYEGILMMLLASFTEALIYFIVRDIKTENNWNHLFISYALGSIALTLYYFKDIQNIEIKNTLSISLIINLIIGLFGYLLRFFAIYRLDPKIYAPLSYFGILMAYIYGTVINKDVVTIKKIIGTIFILIPNIYILLQ